jgi:hypothetical protein
MRRYCLGVSLILLSLLACDRSQPLEPAMQAAAAQGPAPTAPSNTRAGPMSESRIAVSWRDNSWNETGFEVHRSVAGPNGPFTLVASTGATVAFYADGGLSSATEYCYSVRAFKRAKDKTSYSDFSNVACATTPTPPPPPPPPAAAGGAEALPWGASVFVLWIDNSTNEDGFRVERSSDGGSTWTIVETADPNLTSSIASALGFEQQVCYRVIAFNGGGEAAPSNIDCTTPLAGPTDLTATWIGLTGDVELTWTDNSGVEDGYELWSYTVDGEGWLTFQMVALPPNTTRYVDPASIGPTYYVYATKDGGRSYESNHANPGPRP